MSSSLLFFSQPITNLVSNRCRSKGPVHTNPGNNICGLKKFQDSCRRGLSEICLLLAIINKLYQVADNRAS